MNQNPGNHTRLSSETSGIRKLMDKTRIIAEIKRLAASNGGKAPGVAVFERETGITTNDWFPSLWLRWSDAVVEAGFSANRFQGAYAKDFLVERYVALVKELGHIPVKGELLLKSKSDKTFPNVKVFYREGKEALLKRVIAYSEKQPELKGILALCIEDTRESAAPEKIRSTKPDVGYVYLMKSGRYYKIGRTVSLGSRERQLAIKIPVPPTTIHSIETDDPVGVEAYWHRRFAEKRGEGEWFELNNEDVAAFKRWRRLV